MLEETTIGVAIRRHAVRHPDSPAVVATGLAPLSYRGLGDDLTRFGTQLRQAGFDRESRIAVALPNGGHAAVAAVAVACTAVMVPIDQQLTAPEIGAKLKLLRPRAIIVARDAHSTAREVATHLGIAVIEATCGRNALSLHLDVPKIGQAVAPEMPTPSSVAFILNTSGTTAAPKLIPFTHRNMVAAAARVQSWFGLGTVDRCLSVAPICYAHGLKVTVFTPLISGGSIAFPVSAATLDVDEWLVRLNPTWYSAGPTLHRFMLDKTKLLPNARSLHRLRFIASAGAPLPADVREGLAATLGVPVLELYGSSETAPIAANLIPPRPSKPGTCGMPASGTVRIVTDDGRALPPGEPGEVQVRGASVISGYLDAPELNRAAFVDGWFRTGDIGCLDAEGFLTLCGRKSELINRGGEKISPTEIDDALLRHPDVAEAAAFAVTHPRLGQDVAAAVVLKKEATATPLALRRFLQAWLAPFKIPRVITIVDSLPKGATGKVQRQQLRKDSS